MHLVSIVQNSATKESKKEHLVSGRVDQAEIPLS